MEPETIEEYNSGQTLTTQGGQYSLDRLLLERFVAGEAKSQECHAVWTAARGQEPCVLKIIQEYRYIDEDWTPNRAAKFSTGPVKMAKTEKDIANTLHSNSFKGTFKTRYYSQVQSHLFKYPGRGLHTLIFEPGPSCRVDNLISLRDKENEIRQGFDQTTHPITAINSVAIAIEKILKDLWDAGFEYEGAWDWLLYDNDSCQWYVDDLEPLFSPLTFSSYFADYTEIYQIPEDLVVKGFSLIRALIHINAPC